MLVPSRDGCTCSLEHYHSALGGWFDWVFELVAFVGNADVDSRDPVEVRVTTKNPVARSAL